MNEADDDIRIKLAAAETRGAEWARALIKTPVILQMALMDPAFMRQLLVQDKAHGLAMRACRSEAELAAYKTGFSMVVGSVKAGTPTGRIVSLTVPEATFV